MLVSKQATRVAVAVMAGILIAGSGATAASADSSSDELSEVSAALAEWGYSPAEIAEMIQDPDLVAAVPVETTVETVRGTKPSHAKFNTTVTPNAVGSSCSGNQGYRGIARTARNMYGNALYTYDTTTRFCYNGQSVTYAYTVDTATITTLGNVGGWSYDGYSSFSEGFGIYNGHTNGKVTTTLQGRFRLSPLRIGLIGYHYENRMTQVRYNGTSTWSESNSGVV